MIDQVKVLGGNVVRMPPRDATLVRHEQLNEVNFVIDAIVWSSETDVLYAMTEPI